MMAAKDKRMIETPSGEQEARAGIAVEVPASDHQGTEAPPAPVVVTGLQTWPCPKCGHGWNVPDPMPAGATASCPNCGDRLTPPVPLVRRTKVAIIGFADSWPMAPYHNPDWEIWGLSQFYNLSKGNPKVDLAKLAAEGRLLWFDPHSRYDLENDPNIVGRDPEHLKKLAGLGCPVYMHQHWDDIPMSVEYPKQRVLDHFGRYFTNSISYMIALAILEGFREIGLYGVNMAQDGEHAFQRPSCEFFLGWARGLGIELHIPPQSDLLSTPYLYGYEDDKTSQTLAKIDQLISEHQQRMANEFGQRDAHDANGQQFNGAIQQLQVMKRIFSIGR